MKRGEAATTTGERERMTPSSRSPPVMWAIMSSLISLCISIGTAATIPTESARRDRDDCASSATRFSYCANGIWMPESVLDHARRGDGDGRDDNRVMLLVGNTTFHESWTNVAATRLGLAREQFDFVRYNDTANVEISSYIHPQHHSGPGEPRSTHYYFISTEFGRKKLESVVASEFRELDSFFNEEMEDLVMEVNRAAFADALFSNPDEDYFSSRVKFERIVQIVTNPREAARPLVESFIRNELASRREKSSRLNPHPETRRGSAASSAIIDEDVIARAGFVGQEHVVEAVRTMLQHVKKGVKSKEARAPIVLLFIGPPGTGKSWLGRLIADAYYKVEGVENFASFDMGNFNQKEDIDSFLAPRAGLVGEGAMVELFMRTARPVVVLDEVEKAHPDLLATMTNTWFDNNGRVVSKKNATLSFPTQDAIFILTSNCFYLGPEAARRTESEQERYVRASIRDPHAKCSSQHPHNPFVSEHFRRRLEEGHSLANLAGGRRGTPDDFFLLFRHARESELKVAVANTLSRAFHEDVDVLYTSRALDVVVRTAHRREDGGDFAGVDRTARREALHALKDLIEQMDDVKLGTNLSEGRGAARRARRRRVWILYEKSREQLGALEWRDDIRCDVFPYESVRNETCASSPGSSTTTMRRGEEHEEVAGADGILPARDQQYQRQPHGHYEIDNQIHLLGDGETERALAAAHARIAELERVVEVQRERIHELETQRAWLIALLVMVLGVLLLSLYFGVSFLFAIARWTVMLTGLILALSLVAPSLVWSVVSVVLAVGWEIAKLTVPIVWWVITTLGISPMWYLRLFIIVYLSTGAFLACSQYVTWFEEKRRVARREEEFRELLRGLRLF